MALAVPPFVPAGTGTRRRTAPPTGTTVPQQSTTTTTQPPPPPPPSPVPTGTTPAPQPLPAPTRPPVRTTPTGAPAGAGPPYQGALPPLYQVPQIPYENNQVILPSEWAKRFPGREYPSQSVSAADAQNVLLDQYLKDMADRSAQQNTAADTLAGQYDAWLRSTQAQAMGQLTGGIASASAINDINNRAIYQSGANQLGLNAEQLVRNRLDIAGIGNSDQLARTQLGLAGEQRAADVGRIRQTWELRNGQFVNDQDYIRGVWGRATDQLGADMGQAQALADQARLGYGYASADLENQVNRTNLQEGTNRRAATSAAAGAGAFGSAGFRDNISDISELAGLNREAAWNTYEQQRDAVTGNLRDIDFQRGNLQRDYAGDVAGFQKQLDDNQFGYNADVIGFQYGLGQADREYRGTAASIDKLLKDNRLAAQGLESMARSIGIQNRDIIQTMNTAAQRNNINLSQLISEMNAAYAQGDADRIFQFNQFLYQMIGAS